MQQAKTRIKNDYCVQAVLAHFVCQPSEYVQQLYLVVPKSGKDPRRQATAVLEDVKGMDLREFVSKQQINSIICNNEISPYFMYLTMKEKAEEIKTRGLGGTATLNLNTGDFENIKIILPNKEILTSFHMLVDETFQKILTNEYQIQNLSQIRDSLLPRLMF